MSYSIFQESKPYILVLLVSAVGWMVSVVHEDLSENHVISYHREFQREQKVTWVVTQITNHSDISIEFDADVVIGCFDWDNKKPCLRTDDNLRSTVRPVGVLSSNSNYGFGSVITENREVKTGIKLTPLTGIVFRAPILDHSRKFVIFRINNKTNYNSEGYIIRSYYHPFILIKVLFPYILLSAFIILVGLILAFATAGLRKSVNTGGGAGDDSGR